MQTLNKIIHDAVTDYREETDGKHAPYFSDLDITNKTIILRYLLDCDEYYHEVISSIVKFDLEIKEHEKFVDKLLFDEFDDQYAGFLGEMGMSSYVDRVNGETMWYLP